MAITPITKKRELYSDIGKDLTIHPVSKDVSRKINENSIRESIRNLVLTNRGERPFQPDLGCDVRSQLFENMSSETFATMRTMIKETLSSYEPRAEILGVDIGGQIDSNSITITITFLAINADTPATVDVILTRTR